MIEKLKLICGVLVICGLFAISSSQANKPKDANMWAGIGYLYSSTPTASPEPSLALSAVGAVHSSIWGFAAAGAFGGPAGFAVGLGVGL